MAYAQINYNQPMGSNPSYRINQIGCFLTAFCNLLERFGSPIDPIGLNAIFRDRGIYLWVGDNTADGRKTYDGLGWQSITAYDGNIVVAETGGRTIPNSNNAIVKFNYLSSGGLFTTHFCMVDHIDGGTVYIVDSWDGRVKNSSVYGPVVAWATYRDIKPQVIVPAIPPAPSHPYSVEGITPKTIRITKNTSLWNLDETTWSTMSGNPVRGANAGEVVTVTAIANHNLGGSYYMPDAGSSEGFNVVDAEDYTAPAPPPAPAPAPQRMRIKKAGGAERWSLAPVSSWGEFKSLGHVDEGTIINAVDTYTHNLGGVYMREDASQLAGFNVADLEDAPPEAPAAPAPEPTPEPTPAPVADPVPPLIVDNPIDPTKIDVKVLTPDAWKTTRTPMIAIYRAKEAYQVTDLAVLGRTLQLEKDMLVHAVAELVKDGVTYVQRQKDVEANDGTWYAVPLSVLELVNPPTPEPSISEDDIFKNLDISNEVKLARENSKASIRKMVVAAVGYLYGLFHRNKNKKENTK